MMPKHKQVRIVSIDSLMTNTSSQKENSFTPRIGFKGVINDFGIELLNVIPRLQNAAMQFCFV